MVVLKIGWLKFQLNQNRESKSTKLIFFLSQKNNSSVVPNGGIFFRLEYLFSCTTEELLIS